MDGRGRLTQPLMRMGLLRRKPAEGAAYAPRRADLRIPFVDRLVDPSSRLGRFVQRRARALFQLALPRGVGTASVAALLLASGAYGMVKGDHTAATLEQLKDARDALGNAAGFRIAAIALTGNQHMSREEILATAGVTGRSSLLFLDADTARVRLMTNPWISEATVLKLYPDRLQIEVSERRAFALWQREGRVMVIAEDGTVLEPYVARRFTTLPLFVGKGAQTRAKEFLAVMERYPEINDMARAFVLVAERRWNIRLKNGIDIRLPETDVEQALGTLVALDRDKKLFSRDIVAVDMRLGDRVSVRLSDTAAQARADALKDKRGKRKGSDA